MVHGFEDKQANRQDVVNDKSIHDRVRVTQGNRNSVDQLKQIPGRQEVKYKMAESVTIKGYT